MNLETEHSTRWSVFHVMSSIWKHNLLLIAMHEALAHRSQTENIMHNQGGVPAMHRT